MINNGPNAYAPQSLPSFSLYIHVNGITQASWIGGPSFLPHTKNKNDEEKLTMERNEEKTDMWYCTWIGDKGVARVRIVDAGARAIILVGFQFFM